MAITQKIVLLALLCSVYALTAYSKDAQSQTNDSKDTQVFDEQNVDQQKTQNDDEEDSTGHSCKHSHQGAERLVFEDVTAQIETYFLSDKTYEAFTLLDDLKKSHQQDKLDYKETVPQGKCQDDLYEEFMNKVLVKKLELNKATFELRYPQLTSTEGWTQFVTEGKKKIFFRKEQGNKVVTQYLEAVIDAPYQNIALLLRAIELYKEWVPLLSEIKLLGKFSLWRQLMYQKFNAPWPLKGREVIIEISGYVLPFEDAFIFSFDSVQGNEWFGNPIKRDKDYVEMLFNKSFGYLKPLGPNQTLFKFIINSDPQLEFVPPGIIDWGIKTVSGGFLDYLINQCQDIPRAHKRHLKEHKKEFDEIFKFMEKLSSKFPEEDTINVTNS
eukprot:403340587